MRRTLLFISATVAMSLAGGAARAQDLPPKIWDIKLGIPIGGFYAGALYAVRDAHVNYTIHEVNGRHAPGKPNLVSVRSYALSPFPSDHGQVIYFGGYDGNWVKSQDTAWIFRTTLSNSLASGPSQSKR